jgi:hypothetical protein
MGGEKNLEPAKPAVEQPQATLPAAAAALAPLDDKKNSDIVIAERTANINAIIDQNHLPQIWHYQEGEDQTQWQALAAGISTMALQTISDIDTMDRLHRMNDNFPLDLPKGASVSRAADDNLTGIKLDLPGDLAHLTEADVAKLHELKVWREKTEPTIQNVIQQTAALITRPRSAIAWGDDQVSRQRKPDGSTTLPEGLFDSNGKFLGEIDGSDLKPGSLPAGFTAQRLNLVESRFDLQTQKNGDITVTQSVKAQDVPWYGYQNLIYDDLGKPMELPAKTYKPDDFVVVQDGGQLALKQAKDLSTLKLENEAVHYGVKTLSVVLDVGMTVSGTVEFGVAYKAARIGLASATVLGATTAGETAKAGMMLARDEAAEAASGSLRGQSPGKPAPVGSGPRTQGVGNREAGESAAEQQLLPLSAPGKVELGRLLAGGALRTTVGVAGLLNNAGADDTAYGSTINQLRGYYFLADTSIGLSAKGISSGLSRVGIQLPKSVEDTKQALLNQQLMMRLLHEVSSVMFKGAEPVMAAQVSVTLQAQIRADLFPSKTPGLTSALDAYRAGQQ